MTGRLVTPDTPPPWTPAGERLLFVLHERLNLLPNRVVPPHAHPGATEVYVVASGGGAVEIEGTTRQVGAQDVITIPPGATHTIRVGEEGLAFSSFMAFPALVPFLVYRAKRIVDSSPFLAWLHRRLRGRASGRG